jgi:hypothetical protein
MLARVSNLALDYRRIRGAAWQTIPGRTLGHSKKSPLTGWHLHEDHRKTIRDG